MPLSPLPILVLALPILEIAGFILVGGWIGLLPTIGLVLLSSVAGALLLRIQGFGAMRRIQADLEARRDPGRQMAHGAMIVLAAILLLIPGFITDLLGLALFVPFVRDMAWRFIRDRIGTVSFFTFDVPGGRRAGDKTIDLETGEFSRRRDGAQRPADDLRNIAGPRSRP